ncbi:MAG: hypothetical protein ACI4Q9_05770 [Candidatus Methanomethylophilaceae archaeon]
MATDCRVFDGCIGNPAKLNILVFLKRNGPVTAKQMLSDGIGIPQTTLYRLLNNLESIGAISVVSETKVRGTIEKTYYLSEKLKDFDKRIAFNNDLEEYCSSFAIFVMNLYNEFKDYTKKEGANIIADGPFFCALPIYATAEEIVGLADSIRELVMPYTSRKSEEQGLHTFATVFTPPCDLGTPVDGCHD